MPVKKESSVGGIEQCMVLINNPNHKLICANLSTKQAAISSDWAFSTTKVLLIKSRCDYNSTPLFCHSDPTLDVKVSDLESCLMFAWGTMYDHHDLWR